MYIVLILGSTRFLEQTKLLLSLLPSFCFESKEFGFTVVTGPAENTEVKARSLRLFPTHPRSTSDTMVCCLNSEYDIYYWNILFNSRLKSTLESLAIFMKLQQKITCYVEIRNSHPSPFHTPVHEIPDLKFHLGVYFFPSSVWKDKGPIYFPFQLSYVAWAWEGILKSP